MNEVRIADNAIDADALRREMAHPACGALVTFEGWVRNHHEGRSVARLEYEVYRPIAISEGLKVLHEARDRWPLEGMLCVHREGELEIGDIAVWVGVISHHRAEAFDACRYVIDEIKVRLPIWKQETFANGEHEWVNCQRCAEHAHG